MTILLFVFLLFCYFEEWFFVYGETYCPSINNSSNKTTDRRSNKKVLRFVQYNAEWLFLDYYASAQCPGSGCPWANISEAQTHLEYIGAVIQDLNPDIVNVCEVEGCDELSSLILSTTPEYVPYLVQGKDTSTGQNVGFITKVDPIISLYRSEERVGYPISGSNCGYTGEPGDTGVSKHYITEMIINNVSIALIGAHLLAFPTDKTRCVEREAQAQVLQNIIVKYIEKGFQIILSGDFNDFDAEILDANNNKPISQVLDILKGFYGLYSGKYILYNAAETIGKVERFTDWWDKNSNCKSTADEFSMIDHILVTELLFESIEKAFVYQNYSEFCGTYNSDHYPVVVDFLL